MRLVKHHSSTRRSITSRRPANTQKHKTEVSAGGLVFKKTGNGIMIAMLKDSYGKWTFPKGHVEKGESYIKAATREIEEEMGLKDLRPAGKLGVIDIWFRDRFEDKGTLIHKYIHYFLFKVDSKAVLVKPKVKEKGERISAVKWISISEIENKSSYKDMRPIVQLALEKLNFK